MWIELKPKKKLNKYSNSGLKTGQWPNKNYKKTKHFHKIWMPFDFVSIPLSANSQYGQFDKW